MTIERRPKSKIPKTELKARADAFYEAEGKAAAESETKQTNPDEFYTTYVSVTVAVRTQFDPKSAVGLVARALEFPAVTDVQLVGVRSNYTESGALPSKTFFEVYELVLKARRGHGIWGAILDNGDKP